MKLEIVLDTRLSPHYTYYICLKKSLYNLLKSHLIFYLNVFLDVTVLCRILFWLQILHQKGSIIESKNPLRDAKKPKNKY